MVKCLYDVWLGYGAAVCEGAEHRRELYGRYEELALAVAHIGQQSEIIFFFIFEYNGLGERYVERNSLVHAYRFYEFEELFASHHERGVCKIYVVGVQHAVAHCHAAFPVVDLGALYRRPRPLSVFCRRPVVVDNFAVEHIIRRDGVRLYCAGGGERLERRAGRVEAHRQPVKERGILAVRECTVFFGAYAARKRVKVVRGI